jgi:cell division GTPase FtsZ
MKLVVFGIGGAGGRLADEFARIDKNARSARGLNIVTDTFVADTDAEDLTALQHVKVDYQHRILIGARQTSGHGLAGDIQTGAEIARDSTDALLDAVRADRRIFEADIFLIAAGGAGGTGSGSAAIVASAIRERYASTPIYGLVALPFRDQVLDGTQAAHNTATCLKSIYSVADAVILHDNQKYAQREPGLRDNLDGLNRLIVAPFYNLLCVGEEKNHRYVGAKTLDAGDLMQVFSGWTAMGRATLPLPRFNFSRKRLLPEGRGVMSVDDAINALSVHCRTADTARAAFLVSGPGGQIDVTLIKEIGNHLRDITSRALIRDGDYPRQRNQLEVVVVLSHLSDVETVREYYQHTNHTD